METIFNKIQIQSDKNLPFVVYRKPEETKLIGVFQKNDTLFFVDDYKEKGFVFAPFIGDKVVLIPENISDIFVSKWDCKPVENNTDYIIVENIETKNNFEKMVQQGIDAIKNYAFTKVVLSRKEIVDIPDFNITTVFTNLLNEYPTAYVYCFFHPKVGLWMGAFSEQLLKVEGNKFHTMSVAGTQLFQENEAILWQNKEKVEQQLVTDFIVRNLKSEAQSIIVSKPFTLKAGNLVHLKTDINGFLNMNSNLSKLVTILHPTPAVCGLPKDKAKEFIIKYEGYDREYYAGFFGEMNTNFTTSENITDFYVNLRCVQIKNKSAHLYIGCGITKDSIPENEWNETVNKSMTIKKCILKF
jgi:isochorismate synthase